MRTSLQPLATELGTTDRTLRRALNQGLIRAERRSPRTVDIPMAERAYLRQMWPLLSGLRQTLRTEPGVRLAVLFGSHARGDAHRSSDVDLLVNLRDGTDRSALASRLAHRVGLQVHLAMFEDAERMPLLFRAVLSEGRVVVDRDRVWPKAVRQQSRIEREAKDEQSRIEAEFSKAFPRSQAA